MIVSGPRPDQPANPSVLIRHTEREADGLYTYYRATVFGEVTLTSGVDELIRGEKDFEAMYDSSAE